MRKKSGRQNSVIEGNFDAWAAFLEAVAPISTRRGGFALFPSRHARRERRVIMTAKLGRVQKYRIVGEDEADPKAGSISFVSPVARLLIGKAVGDEVGASGRNLEIISIS